MFGWFQGINTGNSHEFHGKITMVSHFHGILWDFHGIFCNHTSMSHYNLQHGYNHLWLPMDYQCYHLCYHPLINWLVGKITGKSPWMTYIRENTDSFRCFDFPFFVNPLRWVKWVNPADLIHGIYIMILVIYVIFNGQWW